MSSIKENPADNQETQPFNELRFSLLTTHTVNQLEKKENFETVIHEHVNTFEPKDGVQEGIVEGLASAYWRIRRLAGVENVMMNQAIGDTSAADTPLHRMSDALGSLLETRKFNLLNQYEARLDNRYHRAIRTFHVLQEKRQRKAESKK